MRVAAQVKLTAIERRRLETWSSARSTAVRLVERSKIVLMACAGMTNQAIAKALGIDQNTVGRWRNRFVKERVKGIEKERPRGGNHGGKDSKRQAKLRARIIGATTQTTPKDATHWSTRTMARAMGTTHVPHPVSWTHVYATRLGVACIPRGLQVACDTPASRGASTGCSVRRTRRRPRAPRRGFERPGRRRLAP